MSDPLWMYADELAIEIREEVNSRSGVESTSRLRGTPSTSAFDILTDDGRQFIVTIEEKY